MVFVEYIHVRCFVLKMVPATVLKRQNKTTDMNTSQKNQIHVTFHENFNQFINIIISFNLGRSAQNAAKSKANHQLSRMERRNQAKILRKTKTENVLNEKRRSLNVPHLVAVIPLSNNVFVNEKMMEMINVLQKSDVKLTTAVASEGYSHLWLAEFVICTQCMY